MIVTGDLIPQSSGSASIGVVQIDGIGGFDRTIVPYAGVYMLSGVFHNIYGSSGILRFDNNSNHIAVSKDGGINYGTWITTNDTIASSKDRSVEFCLLGSAGDVFFDEANTFVFTKTSSLPTVGISGVLDFKFQSQYNVSNAQSGITRILGDNTATMTQLGIIGSGLMSSRIKLLLESNFFCAQKFYITTSNGSALKHYGGAETTIGTVTHATSSPGSGRFAIMTTAVGVGSTAGAGSTNTMFFRGAVSGFNTGFFSASRVTFGDATYSSLRAFVGLCSSSLINSVAADDPTGSFAGFQYSTARGDTEWQFMTKDSTTQSLQNTKVAFNPNVIYDMFSYCPPFPNNGIIYWTISDLSNNTIVNGYAINNLPLINVDMRTGFQINNITATARSIHFLNHMTESL